MLYLCSTTARQRINNTDETQTHKYIQKLSKLINSEIAHTERVLYLGSIWIMYRVTISNKCWNRKGGEESSKHALPISIQTHPEPMQCDAKCEAPRKVQHIEISNSRECFYSHVSNFTESNGKRTKNTTRRLTAHMICRWNCNLWTFPHCILQSKIVCVFVHVELRDIVSHSTIQMTIYTQNGY